ncbi:tRNA (guanosine(46)-N7)-methyltransferase TrmB [uncultured Ruminococcus sp.]|uniref:tRNA (guanosine(46)-N7)-methyltransferase TrmB n=1 Tax=uncultured Ruminococcus sp. TaxID=165186 RepID=UPI0025EC6A0F|nr:tRNA (guanosine(46)-N7)-methyltransferase TrmB [uncultured Ruminococcus sp.]
MRMRRKNNLEERLAACGDRILYLDRDVLDFSVKDDRDLLDISGIFGNDNPVELEIGCGKGQFIRELAKREPDVNFLAVEVSSNVIVDAAETVIKEGLDNVRFMRGNARYLDCFIPAGLIRRIYLNFSCPYPKNTYANHRLTHGEFLKIYRRILAEGGDIHQKTDNMHFFEFSLEQFSENGYGLRNISLDLHNSGFEDNIVTEYEKRFSDMGMPIYRLEAYLREK